MPRKGPEGGRAPSFPGPYPYDPYEEILTRLVDKPPFRNRPEEPESEAELRARLAAILDTSEDAIFSTDLEGIITSWNAGAERLYGFTREEATGRSVSMLVPDAHADEIPSIRDRLKRGERVSRFETVRQTKDGRRLRVSLSASPISDDEGQVTGTCVVARDIGERREAERALLESRERADELSALMDSVPAVVVQAHDPQTRRITGNRRAHEAFRVPLDGNLSLSAEESERPRHFRVLQDGVEVSLEKMPIHRAAQGEPRYDQEWEIRFRDGRVMHLFGNAIPVYDRDGNPRGALAAMIDITERKRAEQELRESEERLRFAKVAAGIGTHEYHPSTGVVVWDERTREIWGVDEDEPISYDLWLSSVHPDDRGSVQVALERALDPDDDASYNAEYRVINRRDGTTRWVQATGAVTYSEGRPVRLVGTVRDRTEQKKAEEELQEAHRRKDAFLATLSHELRNPLAAIRTALYALGEEGKESAPVRAMTEIIERQSSHLVRLIDDLLDVSRISLGKMALRRERIDVAAVVRQVIADSSPLSKEGGLRLSASVPEEPIKVDADRVRIAQVVNNLLHNAYKFTPVGGEIRVTVETDDGEVVIRVADTGVGMTAEERARVFEMFGQADEGVPGEGLGIGLSLARSIVELHGGSIEAKSAGPGLGSEFLMRIQAADTEAREVEGAGEPAGSGKRRRSTEARRIVLGEDSFDLRQTLALVLEGKGYEVETAANGSEAFEKAQEHRPDIVLLDIGMPRMDGYEVARRIRSEPWGGEMLLIAMTGWGQERDQEMALEAGFDAHLVKPVDLDVLLEALQEQRG